MSVRVIFRLEHSDVIQILTARPESLHRNETGSGYDRDGPVLPANALARLPHRREGRGDDEKVQAQQVSGLGVGLRQAMDLDDILPDLEGTGLDPIALLPCHLLGAFDLFDWKEEIDVNGCPRARVDREREPAADGIVHVPPLESIQKSAELIDEIQHSPRNLAP